MPIRYTPEVMAETFRGLFALRQECLRPISVTGRQACIAGVEALPQTTAGATAPQLRHNSAMRVAAAGEKELGGKVLCVSERNSRFKYKESSSCLLDLITPFKGKKVAEEKIQALTAFPKQLSYRDCK